MLTDTHAHLTDVRFAEDYADVLIRAKAAGVETIINVGCDLLSSREAVSLAAKTHGFYAAVGIHPHEAAGAQESSWQELKRLTSRTKVVAIGEIGLDYYYDHSPRTVQIDVFRRQIRLAGELSLPVIIHDRDAHEDIYRILREENAQDTGGVLHCFSGDVAFARRCLDLGFYISLAGPVTFKNPKELPQVAGYVPLDRLLVETDCPYLAPAPFRGKRNEPAYVLEVAKKVAEIRALELEDFAAATTSNARKLFSLDKFDG